ncbi:hypothetical protein GCM10027285_11650 [Oleiagrimonas citrea]
MRALRCRGGAGWTRHRALEKAARPGGINVGVCCLHWALLASFSIGEGFSLEHDVLVPNVLKEPVAAFTDTSQFIDIGMPKGYQRVQETFAARN